MHAPKYFIEENNEYEPESRNNKNSQFNSNVSFQSKTKSNNSKF